MTRVQLADTVTAADAGWGTDTTGYIVGTPPVWKDGSDATYASFAGAYLGNGNPSYGGLAEAMVESTASVVAGIRAIKVEARIAAVQGSGVRMPRFLLRQNFSGGVNVVVSPDGLCPTAPSWVAFQFPMDANALQQFENGPASWKLTIGGHEYFSPDVPNETQRWNVYEARLLVVYNLDAPPCRIWPRDDEFGVGAGRNYPPPKSQQRSSRGVGYY